MILMVNGEKHAHRGDGTLLTLLQELQADGNRVATMVNDAVVGKEQRAAVTLREGDRVEVLMFAGGG
jgi:sulfur carrier protein